MKQINKFYFVILLVFTLFFYTCSSKEQYSNENTAGTSGYYNSMLEGGYVYYDDETTEKNIYPESDDLDQYEETKKVKQNDDLKKNDPDEPENQDGIDIKNLPKKIIKTGNISCEVNEYAKTKYRLDSIVKKWGAYITQETEYRTDWQITNNIVIRVEVEKFDSLIDDLIVGMKSVESKQILARDVTEEYIDVFTRLQNKKKEEAQYLEVLKKAYTIRDILEVNNYIYSVREEIEAKEGRLKYLDNQSSLSTINLYLHEDFESVSNFEFLNRLLTGFEKGWYGFLSFFVGLAYIWPIIIIFGLILFFIIRKIRKNRRIKKNNF